VQLIKPKSLGANFMIDRLAIGNGQSRLAKADLPLASAELR
jgi:hypothetical protein